MPFDCILHIFSYIFIRFSGGNGEEDTPVPIPNTEVKLFSADGTARAAEWESRTPPKFANQARINPNLWSGLFAFVFRRNDQ